jgi:hypothetical protein
MAKKEITKEQADKFISAYAKKHEVSEAKAKEMILHTGISRLATLDKAAKKKGGGGGGKKAAPKKAAKKAAKKAKKAPRKPKAAASAAPTKVSEGEE